MVVGFQNDRAVFIADEGAEQGLFRIAQMFEQREHGALAIVEGDVVDVIEHPWF